MSYYDEKKDVVADVTVGAADTREELNGISLDYTAKDLQASEADVLQAEELANTYTSEEIREILSETRKNHEHDQNFNTETLHKIMDYLDNPDVLAHPKDHAALIQEMSIEAALIKGNSPYAMVRAAVDPYDDPNTPSLTFRVWFVGIIFTGLGTFINTLFTNRMPNISVGSDVAQFLAYPAGKALEKILPTARFTLFGYTMSLNPGPFSSKEQMLITIMANASFGVPYTNNIIFTQVLPRYFDQAWAHSYGYQVLNTLGSSFVGLGIAGVCRRFLVWPSYCVWPTTMSTLALNKAFHSDDSASVLGPFRRLYSWSRMNFFWITAAAMFVYFWLPDLLFTALSYFNWILWISPNNNILGNLTGLQSGLGLNPWPTFDYNFQAIYGTGLTTPLFTVLNMGVGVVAGSVMMIILWFKNAWNTAYLPLNDNHTWDNTASPYNVSRILTNVKFDEKKYQAYSQPWMAAGNLTIYFFFFAAYASTVSYTLLYHRHEIGMGLKGAYASIKSSFKKGDTVKSTTARRQGEDIHYRLMQAYPEVSELWYFAILVVALVFGIVGLKCWPTDVSPGVVFYGLMLAIVFVVPIGIIAGITGQQVTLNVLAEFIGGAIGKGSALSLNYFKMYGYITTAQTIGFANDQKLGHYAHVPPKHTFWVQIVATFISCIVSCAIFNFQMTFKNVCTTEASWRMTCPGVNTFFTAAVFWGTVGPTRIFGPGSRYMLLLLGFPIGLVIPFIFWGLRKKWPRSGFLRKFHPVMVMMGALGITPYPVAMYLCFLYTNLFSWGLVRNRWPQFWARYNFVLAASFGVAIAISSLIIFFGVQMSGYDERISWWGNNVNGQTIEATTGLTGWKELPAKGYYGPEPGHYV